jgi:hypothetical protein
MGSATNLDWRTPEIAYRPPCPDLDGDGWTVKLGDDLDLKKARTRHAMVLGALDAEFNRATGLLELGHDWDGEGSSGYSTITLNRSIQFLKHHATYLWQTLGVDCPVPKMGPGPNGTIDIHWKEHNWELLVNIPETGVAAFYGDDYGKQKIKGSLEPEKFNSGIAEWLKK